MSTSTAVSLADRLAGVVDRRRLAVVPIRGVIGGAVRTADLVRTLDRARESKQIRAVLLDIASPGGDAVASETLYLAVKRLAATKPVVAWIRSVGASGSYFAACGATRILAFPAALVGSIGVISARPVLVDLLQRIGARMHVVKTGPFKDLGAPWREPTDEDQVKERELIDGMFRHFTGAVREARNYDDESLALVTTGEVWLADRALELGLVDALAEEEEALAEAQRLGDMPRRRVIRLHPRRSLLQRLGMPGAGMGPPGPRWIVELEGWSRLPRLLT
ncbi:MAG TPA: signal peptide peptidase SppA [Candidatus Dormibacteraeota bacterium]|jgi:protease-4|nr:signal peptide peptidase SppA [Candidatus Dormibacteraeota bacterium]